MDHSARARLLRAMGYVHRHARRPNDSSRSRRDELRQYGRSEGQDNLYAGHDGNVYKRDDSGDWSKWDNGQWNPVNPPSGNKGANQSGQNNLSSQNQRTNLQNRNANGASTPQQTNRKGRDANGASTPGQQT